MKQYLKIVWILLAVLGVCGNQLSAQPATLASGGNALSDSLLQAYSLDELISYKRFYEGERERLEGERSRIREKSIRDLEAFVRNHKKSKVLDKIYFRLAELYYDQATEMFNRGQEKYSDQLALYDAKQLSELPAEPKKDYSKSLELFQKILDDFPISNLLDDAFYNIAFLEEELGDADEANRLYSEFRERFPLSPYIVEVLMRQAEYHFNPPRNELETAVEVYKKILQYTDNPKYDEALYRLGWCYYRMNNFPQAIAYFTMLAEDIHRAGDYDPANKISNPVLSDEAVEYIGISFLDYSGVQGAFDYIKSIGNREFGFDVLKKMGDSYLDAKEEYDLAIKAYEAMLNLYPYSREAPVVQAKIAEAYRRKRDDKQTYLMQKKLFKDYREGSDWWEHVTDPDAREKAARLAEHSVRANINLLLEKADRLDDVNLYLQAVNDSREYLKYFAKDTNAVRIHWNMALTLDAKLKRPESAFKEYLKISNDYWDDAFQKDAAMNAIALAQDFIAADTASSVDSLGAERAEARVPAGVDSGAVNKLLQLQPEPLTESEKKLAAAIDNFIKLFPFDPETPARLSQCGSIYYNRLHFAGALKYFKTLLKHFPEDTLADYARFIVMESYFGKRDYKSVEVMAKRIPLKTTDAKYVTRARQRLAEAIFLSAEAYADSGRGFLAAQEYLRVVKEVPDIDFADLALFNAGLEFDKVWEYMRALETYRRLIEDYPKSQYYLAAMNNMALDYGELQDFENAALVFERLAEEDPDSSKAETHLYNASVYFAQAEDWQRALRVNQKFVSRYPESDDAENLFYDMATYHLKLGNVTEANEIYYEYAQKFPDSPRVVETHFRRGEYFKEQGKFDVAMQEYAAAISKSEAFASASKDGNDFFAAEALFSLTELKFDAYERIQFRLPEDDLQKSKALKKKLLLEIAEGYAKVAAYGTIRLYEATYKIGRIYEEFAKTWRDQDVPATSETRRIVARKGINKVAADLFEKAHSNYRYSLEVLTRLAEEYRASVEDSSGDMSRYTPGAKIILADSTLRVADRWIKKTREGVSKTVFDIAETQYATILELLGAPVPVGLDHIGALEFRNQLLGKFIRPLAADVVATYKRNLDEAKELDLDNTWVQLAKKKLVVVGSIPAEEYATLAWQAMRYCDESIERYVRAINQDHALAPGIADDMANYIDFARAYAGAAIDDFGQTVENARSAQIRNYELFEAENQLFEFVYSFASYSDSLGRAVKEKRNALSQAAKTDANAAYKEALTALEDNYSRLAATANEVFSRGFELAQLFDVANEFTAKITIALVHNEPEKYAGLLKLRIQEEKLYTDTTWVATTALEEGWENPDYIDAGWHAPNIRTAAAYFQNGKAQRIWMGDSAGWQPAASGGGLNLVPAAIAAEKLDTLAGQSAAAQASQYGGPRRATTTYFRKSLEIIGLPVQGSMQIYADDHYRLYINGELISDTKVLEHNHVPHTHDFSDFLRAGKNVIAVQVIDTDASGGGLEGLVFIKNLPGWAKRQAEIRARKEREKEKMLFDKGIITKKSGSKR